MFKIPRTIFVTRQEVSKDQINLEQSKFKLEQVIWMLVETFRNKLKSYDPEKL